MFTKNSTRFLLALTLLVFASLACNFSFSVSNGPVAQAPSSESSNIATEDSVVSSSSSAWDVTGFNGTVCPAPEGMVDRISPETDFRAMVRMADGRLFQPCLPEEAVRPAFESSFTGYCIGETNTCQMTYHGINSSLWYDSDKDGTAETLLADKVGSKVVTITNGGWYKIKAGSRNGGIDLVPFK